MLGAVLSMLHALLMTHISVWNEWYVTIPISWLMELRLVGEELAVGSHSKW